MPIRRSSGVLLHPTSLPGPFGIGDFGPEAKRFVEFLSECGQKIWQVLPLGPTGFGDSPYQSFSSAALNPLLISPDWLLERGWLRGSAVAERPPFPAGSADYGHVIVWKKDLIGKAWNFFRDTASSEDSAAFQDFRERSSSWLSDFSTFMAAKETHEGNPWWKWEDGLRDRDPEFLERLRKDNRRLIDVYEFAQFTGDEQWREIRLLCQTKDIRILGDLPFYVALDSADVWSHPECFKLDEKGNPTVVAGVPPDYFSPTGQLWGNPIYRWEDLKKTGFAWWIERFEQTLRHLDMVRLDHFLGFSRFWEVSAKEKTAEKGRWVQAPGEELFEALQKKLGHSLPIVAENLGLVTDEAESLRKRFGFPGMAVFQFGFGTNAETSPHLPFEYERDLVAYTGTHDNDTLWGWWENLAGKESARDYVLKYLGPGDEEFHWRCIRNLMASVASTVIFPIQDVLGLGGEGRLNRPGSAAGNWTWRLREEALREELAERLLDMTQTYGRGKGAQEVSSADTNS